MWKKIKEGAYVIIALSFFSCFIATAVLAGILLMPLAMLIVLVLGIKEIFRWRKKPSIKKTPIKEINVHYRKANNFPEPIYPVEEVYTSYKREIIFQ